MSYWASNPNGGSSASVPGYDSNHDAPERGLRRKKLAAMASSVYRAGAAAASELKNQYDNTRIRGLLDFEDSQISIPGSFPDVAIITKGEEQMVLFPSYAKKHVQQQHSEHGQRHDREESTASTTGAASGGQWGPNNEDYWRREWERNEDKKAVVDVDVRGWVYSPHKGPLTRKNRVLIGLARRLSGIPAPTQNGMEPVSAMSASTAATDHESAREQQKIAKEAEQILKRGQAENEAAQRGGYSETPKVDDSDGEGSMSPTTSRSGNHTPLSAPASPNLGARRSNNAVAELTEAELAVANTNLMARLGPFLTDPLAQLPVTLFFYNDKQSQSRTVVTNEAGHFSSRAALDFVPTHVRVLANENLSVVEPVQIISSRGVSLISDIDDTIKKSTISLGAREIFRNTFIRDLKDLTVEGVREWYTQLHDLGVQLHYCSNSPWQLFPVIATFFRLAGLPAGSLHLKQYSGMLQGIFEPVAERKKGTLEKILRDFPERKFILVGDSGEADLEVYTDLAIANPNRILAVFIRDVTTPELPGYFDAAFQGGQQSKKPGKAPSRANTIESLSLDDTGHRPNLPQRGQTEPAMGDLIDFSEEPASMQSHESAQLAQAMASYNLDSSKMPAEGRKVPPQRPMKPSALRSLPSQQEQSQAPPRVRKTSGPQANNGGLHPLAQIQNSSDASLASPQGAQQGPSNPTRSSDTSSTNTTTKSAPPPPPPRRRGTPSSFLSLSPRLGALRRSDSNNSNADVEPLDSLPPAAVNSSSSSSWAHRPSNSTSPDTGLTPAGSPRLGPVNKKLEMWRRRLERAHEVLSQHGVQLYTWRRGEDVIEEAVGIVKHALAKEERRAKR